MSAPASPARRLVLVRHSLPEIRREIPSADWHLSPEGIARATAFASRLDPGTARQIFTSVEPKAMETAQALAGVWELPVEAVDGLHEHERPQAAMLSRDVFEERIRALFARPGELMFGAETADHARRRFTASVMRLVMRESADVIVVSHGTVMTLFAAEAAGVEPFTFWKDLEMPCAASLTIPELTLARIVRLRATAAGAATSSSG